VLYMLKYGT